jgi:biotin carboxyl carrier protein
MDTKNLAGFIAWAKTTDLQEILFKNKDVNIEIKTAKAGLQKANYQCSLYSIKAPALGIFYAGTKGKAITLREDMFLEKGQILGYIEAGKTMHPVVCSFNGKLKVISIENGQSVEYNQPLFFIDPEQI